MNSLLSINKTVSLVHRKESDVACIERIALGLALLRRRGVHNVRMRTECCRVRLDIEAILALAAHLRARLLPHRRPTRRADLVCLTGRLINSM